MSHLSASLPVVQYLHYHTKHCPPNPSEASLSLDGVLLSQPTKKFLVILYILSFFIYFINFFFFYLYMYLEYVFRPGEVGFFSLLFSIVVHVIMLQAFKGQNSIKSGINQFITDLTVTDDSIIFDKY